jgi:hypothetical protein
MLTTTQERHRELVDANTALLRQIASLLRALDDQAFTAAPPHIAPHKASGHLRHILEFYLCFLDGLECCHIDYDARRRDPLLEQNRAAAAACIESIISRLEPVDADGIVFVRLEDASALGIRDPYLTSSAGRELQALASHTTHHMALMALTLLSIGVSVPPGFGMARSTLRHLETAAKKAA